MAEIMMGSGKRLGLSTGMARCRGDEEAKKLFAETTDWTMWHSYLGKTLQNDDDVPDGWVDAMDLLRQCTRPNPLTRITAREILLHPFVVKNADKITEIAAVAVKTKPRVTRAQ